MDVSTYDGYQAIVDAINTLSADGGTNLEQGLDKAQDLFGDSTIPGTASKNIIALTDGKPTYYNAPYDHSLFGIFPDVRPDGTGKNCDEGTFKATKGKAESIRGMGYSLYSICFAAGNEKLTVPKGVGNSNGHQKISLLDYLSTYIAPNKTYSANDFSGLKDAFAAISSSITTGLSSGTVHDSLPTGVTSSAIPNGTADWDLKDFEKGEEKVGDTTTYTYTKSYTVTIDPTVVNAEQYGGYYPLNGPTTLTVKDSNNEDVTIDFPIPAGKVTLPEPEKYTYTLTYNANGGSGAPEKQEVKDTTETSNTFTVSNQEPTREGYKFLGWSTSNATDATVNVGETVTVTKDEPSKTIYAVWQQNTYTYTLTYDANGGSGAPDKQEVKDSTDASMNFTVSSTKPSRDGYTFLGWATTKDATTSDVGETVTVTKDAPSKTIYAVWKQNTYTVKFESNGGSTVADQKVNYNDKATKPTNPTRSGYTFDGWYDKELKNTYNFGTPVTADITLYAKWNTNYVPYYPPVPPTVKIEDDDALGLNTTDHFAYIVGYGNGEVRPQNNITRAEVATIFFRLLTDDVRDENLTKTNRYSDVAATSWYNTAVSTLSSMGIITGYPDGTFRPNAAITRAEFAAIAARFDNDGDKTAAKFSDIANHWAKDEISIAYNNGWITGYPDGTFGPQRDITRAETMTLVNRVLNRQPETEDDLLPNMTVWTDNANPKAWYYLAVQEATNSHYYKFKTNSKYEQWTALRETRDWKALEQ